MKPMMHPAKVLVGLVLVLFVICDWQNLSGNISAQARTSAVHEFLMYLPLVIIAWFLWMVSSYIWRRVNS